MSANKYIDHGDSDSESDDEIDVHNIVKNGTMKELQWALQKDRFKLLNLKDEVGSRHNRF